MNTHCLGKPGERKNGYPRQQIVACEANEEAAELSRQMQALWDRRVEELRDNVNGLPSLASTHLCKG